MRRLALLCSAALLAPGIALAQQQFCAIDGQPPAAPPPATATVQAVPVNNNDRNVYPVIRAEEIARSPALTRIASRGATLLDLGVDDGIRTVFAYLGESMEVFHVSPSGRYAVRSGRLLDLAEPDPAKRDLTMRRASIIPGVVPSVDMRGQPSPQEAPQAAPQAQDGNAVLAQLEKADYGVAGRPDAPRLYAFIDPLCSFSVRLIEALRPHVAAGRIQVAILPLALIDYETNGRSTPAAQTLLSQPSEAMDSSWRGMVDAVRAKRADTFCADGRGAFPAGAEHGACRIPAGAGHPDARLAASGRHPAGADGRPGSRPGGCLPGGGAAVSGEEKPRRGALRWVGRKGIDMTTAYPRFAWQATNPAAIQAEAANIRRLWTVLRTPRPQAATIIAHPDGRIDIAVTAEVASLEVPQVEALLALRLRRTARRSGRA